MSEKRIFVEETLARVICDADPTVAGLTLTNDGDAVAIHYNDGGKVRIQGIWGSSRLAIIADVTRECLR
jgi:hypothetical protein